MLRLLASKQATATPRTTAGVTTANTATSSTNSASSSSSSLTATAPTAVPLLRLPSNNSQDRSAPRLPVTPRPPVLTPAAAAAVLAANAATDAAVAAATAARAVEANISAVRQGARVWRLWAQGRMVESVETVLCGVFRQRAFVYSQPPLQPPVPQPVSQQQRQQQQLQADVGPPSRVCAAAQAVPHSNKKVGRDMMAQDKRAQQQEQRLAALVQQQQQHYAKPMPKQEQHVQVHGINDNAFKSAVGGGILHRKPAFAHSLPGGASGNINGSGADRAGESVADRRRRWRAHLAEVQLERVAAVEEAVAKEAEARANANLQRLEPEQKQQQQCKSVSVGDGELWGERALAGDPDGYRVQRVARAPYVGPVQPVSAASEQACVDAIEGVVAAAVPTLGLSSGGNSSSARPPRHPQHMLASYSAASVAASAAYDAVNCASGLMCPECGARGGSGAAAGYDCSSGNDYLDGVAGCHCGAGERATVRVGMPCECGVWPCYSEQWAAVEQAEAAVEAALKRAKSRSAHNQNNACENINGKDRNIVVIRARPSDLNSGHDQNNNRDNNRDSPQAVGNGSGVGSHKSNKKGGLLSRIFGCVNTPDDDDDEEDELVMPAEDGNFIVDSRIAARQERVRQRQQERRHQQERAESKKNKKSNQGNDKAGAADGVVGSSTLAAQHCVHVVGPGVAEQSSCTPRSSSAVKRERMCRVLLCTDAVIMLEA